MHCFVAWETLCEPGVTIEREGKEGGNRRRKAGRSSVKNIEDRRRMLNWRKGSELERIKGKRGRCG